MTEQLVYGFHAVHALLEKRMRPIKKVYVNKERDDSRIEDILKLTKQHHIQVEPLTLAEMSKRFSDHVHQGVVASVGSLPVFTESDIKQLLTRFTPPYLILILDGVTDPHNLGACLRSADAASVNFVVIPKDKSAGLSPTVSKVACGAAESMPLVSVTNLVRVMEMLKEVGIWVYGAAGEATSSLYQLDCQASMAFVLGAEGKGLRRLTREHCDGLFSLPMYGTVSSLNVSVATGICLYETVRQRSLKEL